jgi:hypothetical protein
MRERKADGASSRRIECYVRAALPASVGERQRERIERLRRLETDGGPAVTIHTWPKRVALDGPAADALAPRRYRAFAAWAHEHGVSIGPFFETRTCRSFLAEEPRRELRTPSICLAAYVDDALRWVAPHTDADRTCTVVDALDALEEGDPAAVPNGTAERAAVR